MTDTRKSREALAALHADLDALDTTQARIAELDSQLAAWEALREDVRTVAETLRYLGFHEENLPNMRVLAFLDRVQAKKD